MRSHHTEGRVRGPGVYEMSAALYHSDPSPEPSLNCTVAKALLEQTPRHAELLHPRLNPAHEAASSRRLELGSVAHELLIGRGRGIHPIDADSYRTKAAQQERDEALASGLTPILSADLACAERIVEAVQERVARIPDMRGAFADGDGETVAVWRDRAGIWGRTMIDWWSDDRLRLFDLKTTSAGLSDRALASRIAEGLDLQAAWIEQGVTTLLPELAGRLRFFFVFVEVDEPHEVRVVELDGAGREIGRRKVERAARLFRECLDTRTWPGYPLEVARLEYPSWAENAWLAREMADAPAPARRSPVLTELA